MKTLYVAALTFAMSTQLSAEDLRPAPEYYVDALFALTMAEALATSCNTVGMDLLAAGAATTELREKLTADGFDGDQAFSQMIDPGPAMRAMQAAFLDKHPGLNDPSEEVVCAVAAQEIAEETMIGAYLFEGAALE